MCNTVQYHSDDKTCNKYHCVTIVTYSEPMVRHKHAHIARADTHIMVKHKHADIARADTHI